MKESKYKIYSTTQEAWSGMLKAIGNAKKTIYWEIYIFVDDETGVEFFDLLEKKASAGVDVKLVVDSLGSFWVSRKRIHSLKKSGVDLIFFNERKKRYRGWWKYLWTRTHRKILVVDEKIGFIGGVNIRKDMKDWMDINIKLEGKAVHSLLRSFAKSYIICGGEKSEVKHLFKYKFRVQKDISDLEFIYDDPHIKNSSARKHYTEALLKARERVILFSPYYFPDRKFIEALWKARKRGVKVDLLIPFRSDVRLANYAAYAWFSLMKKHGVGVHLSKNMMHGKGVVVDDDWAMIGSSNIDQSSFYDLYEVNAKISDKKFVKKIKTILEKWLENSDTLDKKSWHKRGKWQQLKERIALGLYQIWHHR